MASTYVNDLRLNEMATGDASGTWGTTTNTNLELIGEALGYGTEAITTNADTHTSTIADGATDPVRAMFVKYTGSLDSACTITIAPNTVNRMHFIENGTSGSQNIIISQGSGANITIPPGDTKAVYLDGAGSGAAVVDAFASLSVVDLKVQDDLTVTDDASVGGNLTLTGNGDFNGDLDVDGTTNLDVVDIDGAVDMASTLQVDGSITSSAKATITVADNSDTLTLVSTDTDASVGPVLLLLRNPGQAGADDDILGKIQWKGYDDGTNDFTAATIFSKIRDASNGSEDSQLTVQSVVAGTLRNRLEFNEGEAVFNDDSIDVDFRVESDGSTHMFFVNGGDNTILMSSNPADDTQSTPHDTLTLALAYSSSSADGAAGLGPRLVFKIPDDETNPSTGGGIAVVKEQADDSNSVAAMTFATSQNDTTLDEHVRISSEGFLGVGTSAPHEMLHVEGADGTQALVAVKEDTATATASYMFKVDSTGTDVRKKAGIIFQRDDPGTRGTGALHICLDGVNDEGSASIADSKMKFDAGGEISITKGRTNFSAEEESFSPGSHNGHFIDINGQSASGRAATNTQTHRSFLNPNGTVGTISTNGSATAYNTSSDYRLKENVVTNWDGTTLLKQLKPSKFNFKTDASTTVHGFLAHEVSSIVPEAVTGEKDAVYTAEEAVKGLAVEGQPKYQGIDQAKLVPLLVKTIQEMDAMITTLEG